MDEERVQRALYVETTLSEMCVRETFSKCGEICHVHIWRRMSTSPDLNYFFVEFVHKSSVKSASTMKLEDYIVYVPAFSPRLASCFRTVISIPDALPAKKKDVFYQRSRLPDRNAYVPRNFSSEKKASSRQKSRPSGSGPDPAPGSPKRRIYAPPVGLHSPLKLTQDKENMVDTSSSPLLFSPPFSEDTSVPSVTYGSITDQNTSFRLSASKYNEPVMAGSSQVTIKTETTLDSPFVQKPSETPHTASPASPTQESAPVTSSSVIVLSYGGDRYSCELDEFTEDPASTVTVLTQTAAHASERDKWMIVACHCRKRNNPRAAISVLIAMVDVMSSPSVGLTKDQLKPVYLMLASCYMDLSREASGIGGESAELTKENIAKATEYLRIVYGTQTPRAQGFQAPQMPSLYSRIRGPKVNDPSSDPAVDRLTAGRNRKSHPSSDDATRLRVMEREIQSLRDRQTNHLSSLSDARTVKRKLEEELHAERNLRRKAEEDLADTAVELQGARRSAKYAIEQCKREVESRRKVEDRAVELRDELAEATIKLNAGMRAIQEKDRKARDCFARLGSLFTQATQGELEDSITPVLSGSSPSSETVLDQPGRPSKRQRTESV